MTEKPAPDGAGDASLAGYESLDQLLEVRLHSAIRHR
jgi:hypothetical protein